MAALVTVAEYKAYAGITGSGDDTVLGILIDSASRALRRYCGRDETTGFAAGTYTEKYDGNGSDTLQLREWPLASVTSVAEVDDAGVSSTLVATEYRANLRTGELKMLGAVAGRVLAGDDGLMTGGGWGVSPLWCDGFQNYTVVYVTSAAVPDDLKFAVYRLVDVMFAERRTNPNYQSETLGAYSYTRAQRVAGQDSLFAALAAPFRTGGP